MLGTVDAVEAYRLDRGPVVDDLRGDLDLFRGDSQGPIELVEVGAGEVDAPERVPLDDAPGRSVPGIVLVVVGGVVVDEDVVNVVSAVCFRQIRIGRGIDAENAAVEIGAAIRFRFGRARDAL